MDTSKKSRIEELARTIAYANSLGVRASLCGDRVHNEEAKRMYREAIAELNRLQASVEDSDHDH
jgi:SRSO17 transposase